VRLRDGLPLHVARGIEPAAGERPDVIDHIARASMRVSGLHHERVLRCFAAHDPAVRSRGAAVAVVLVDEVDVAGFSRLGSGALRSCALTVVPSFRVYSLT
jgi:hypothetical protein